jgi:protease-4
MSMSLRRAAPLAALVVLAACEGRPRSSSLSANGGEQPSVGPLVAVFDLSDGVPEQNPSGWLGLSPKGTSVEDFVRQLETLEDEKDVRGVLVRMGTARMGLGLAAEVGAALAAFGTKHPVWCYADDYGNGSIFLAARGCTRIWASPASSIDAIGIAAQTLYFHRLLADELGLDVDFLQVGKFKGAEEPFTRDGPSDEARQSIESTLSDMRAAWLEGIGKARPRIAEATAESGPYTAEEAKELGLIDDVGYFDEARAAIEQSTGAVRAEVRMGAGATSGGPDGLAETVRALVGDSLSAAPVVVVRASGAISMEGGGILGGGEGIVEHRLIGTLSRLERDDDVKAVVLRIDSPGGSALASDLLWHALMRIRAKKTLVVSIGDMAASGGYYLASTGAVVFADETSIVGSIGVVGGKIAADHAIEKIGVHAETFPAKTRDPHAASRAAYDSLFVPWDAETRARVLDTMTGIYRLFLARVAEGRGIPVERVAASAEGRIFSGRDGKTRGLVDEIGGLREAIGRARSAAGLGPDARVVVAGESSGLLRLLGDEDANSAATTTATVSALLVQRLVGPLAGVAPFVESLGPLADHENAACALPFAITIR